MTISPWPTDIPNDVLVAGYDEAFADNIKEVKTDDGRGLRRKKYTKPPRFTLSATIPDLTRSQVAMLDTFFHTTLADGTLPFTFLHPRKLVNVTTRFVSGRPPRIVPSGSGVYWDAIVSFEIDP